MSMGRSVVICAPIFLVGCMSLSPEAQSVRLVKKADEVKNCTSVKYIDVHANTEIGMAHSETALRNEAAAAGADTVLMLSKFYGTGTAYRCVK